MNILILSAGGPAAVGVIKSLRDFNGKIIAVDCNPLSVGFYLTDGYYVVPKDNSPDFIPSIVEIINEERIDLILPSGTTNSVHQIARNKDKFPSNVNLFMSDYSNIGICNDKLHFYDACKSNFPLPKTSIDYLDMEYPLFVKPRMELGGSRGARICNYIEDLDNKHDYIYQEILSGQEYTIDVLCDMESNPLVVIPRKRLETKAGISTKGEIIKHTFIEEECFNICKYLKLKGPICLQMKEDEYGTPKFIEINPRFGGGTYFTTLAGVNFCKIILDIVNGKKPTISEPKLITVLRYYEEMVI